MTVMIGKASASAELEKINEAARTQRLRPMTRRDRNHRQKFL
jgi:hypothetical protein